MAKKENYINCKYCNQQFQTEKECLEHKCADHLHISIDNYHTWRELIEEAELVTSSPCYMRHPIVDAASNIIMNKLINFERKHSRPIGNEEEKNLWEKNCCNN